MGRSFSLFRLGFIAALVALAFNFLIRLGSLAGFPPESALSEFLRVVPAYIEEPMVQEFGDFAGQLGLIIATLIAASLYGLIFVAFDWYLAERLRRTKISNLEALVVLGLIPWGLFGFILFPIDGDSFFGVGSVFAYSGEAWVFPLTLLLVQGLFALMLSTGYNIRTTVGEVGPVKTPPGPDL